MKTGYVEELFRLFLNAAAEWEVERILQENSALLSWQPVPDLIVQSIFQDQAALLALVQLLSEHMQGIVSRRAFELGLKEEELPADFAELRNLCFPESGQWNTFKDMEHTAEQLSIYADGERFQTNLLFQSAGSMGNLGWPLSALQFCGDKGYLLLARKATLSKWQWTLIRKNAAGTAFEYLLVDGALPVRHSLTPGQYEQINENTTFLQKLYNYALPIGSRSVIAKDLMESLQEFMFEPLLPFIVTDQPSRYAFDRFPQKISFGQAFKLRLYGIKYLEDILNFPMTLAAGKVDVKVYLFKQQLKGMHEQTSKHLIRRTFFKNGMHVIFIDQGLVRAQLGESFIEFELGLPMLKNALLIVVNCIHPIDTITNGLKNALMDNETLIRENERRRSDLTVN